MLYINFLYQPSILIPQLPYYFTMAKAVSSTVELVHSLKSDSFTSFILGMWVFNSTCFLIKLVSCINGQRRTWNLTIYQIPDLPVCLIPQYNWNCHQHACCDWIQAIGHWKATFIESYQAPQIMGEVISLEYRVETISFLEGIIAARNAVFYDFVRYMVIGTRKLGNPSTETAESMITVKKKVGS